MEAKEIARPIYECIMISILNSGPVPGKNAHYAAMDAWFTLEAHVSMCEAGQRAGA